jgi:putative flippase GtrA
MPVSALTPRAPSPPGRLPAALGGAYRSARLRLRREHLLFVLIGIYNTTAGYALFTGLHLAFPHLGYMLVLIVSREVNLVGAFVAYRVFVFKVRGHLLRDFGRFWLVYLGPMLLNLAALPFLVQVLGMNVLAAQALCLVGMVSLSWLGHSRYSFRRSEPVKVQAPGI